MSARDRAKLLHWNIEPKHPTERDQAGEVIAAEIRIWNQEAAKRHARWLALAEDLKLKK